MPKLSAAAVTATFTKLLSGLLAERQACAARLAEIDGMFARYGIPLATIKMTVPVPRAGAAVKPKAKPAAEVKVKRKLHRNSKLYQTRAAALAKAREARWAKFRAAKAGAPQPATPPAKPAGTQPKRKTYEQTSDQFIFALLAGGKRMPTADINKAWKASGRGGTANNTLSLMTQAKKLARQDNEGGRGSVYRWA